MRWHWPTVSALLTPMLNALMAIISTQDPLLSVDDQDHSSAPRQSRQERQTEDQSVLIVTYLATSPLIVADLPPLHL
jgi:hypothetical protein